MLVFVLTPNQVVAYNLPRARLYRGWTQEQAAEALAPYLGTKWSVANFPAIERSVDGGRIRQFTADDLLALSRGFGLPTGFFLIPPGNHPRGVRIATPDTRKEGGVDSMVLLDAVLGTEESPLELLDVEEEPEPEPEPSPRPAPRRRARKRTGGQ